MIIGIKAQVATVVLAVFCMAGAVYAQYPPPGYQGPSGPGFPQAQQGGPSPSAPQYHNAPVPYSRFGSIPQHSNRVPGSGYPSVPGPSHMSPPGQSSRMPASPVDTSRMQSAYSHGDYDRVSKEAESVEQRTRNLKAMSPELPVQDRLKVPLINYQYKQGINNIDRGRDTRNEYKVGIGIQQINDANERLGNLSSGSDGNRSGKESRQRGGDKGRRKKN